MPLQYSKIDLYDVKIALRRKGYGIHSQNGAALCLNVASTTRFRNTEPRQPLREPLRALSTQKLDFILTRSASVPEAVMHIEKYSLGEDTAPEESLVEEAKSPGLSADEIAHLIDNRVGMQVQRELQPVFSQMQSMMGEMRTLLQGVPLNSDGTVAEPEEPEPETEEEEEPVGRPANPVEETARSNRASVAARTPAKKKAAKKKVKKKAKRPPKRSKKETEKILQEMGLGGAHPGDVNDD